MNIHAAKTPEAEHSSGTHDVAQKHADNESSFQFFDHREQSVAQRKVQAMANVSPRVGKAAGVHLMANKGDDSQLLPVQRKANRTGLSDTLKSGIEQLSGHSMDDVKVHYNSDKPAQMQAHAYAQGRDIHLGPGQEKHLPHEAWHVVQQAQGRVRPTMQMAGVGVSVNGDNQLEQEADAMGERALGLAQLRMHRNVEAGTTLPDAGLKSKRIADVQRQTIQRKLVVNGENLSDFFALHQGLAVAEVYRVMISDNQVVADAALHDSLNDNVDHVQRQLYKWMENAPGRNSASPKSHPDYGRKQQDRNYANFYDLARGLVGWVLAKPMRHVEKDVANQVYANEPLQAALDGLLGKLYYKIHDLEKDGLVDAARQNEILTELSSGLSIATDSLGHQIRLGHYQRHLSETEILDGNGRKYHGVPNDQLEILRTPLDFSLRDKVILLHDLMEYFGRKQSWNPQTAGTDLLPIETRDDTMVTTATDEDGQRSASVSMSDGDRTAQKRARGMGLTTGTRDEDAPSTVLARRKGLPVWAGQSMTTVRMMKLAQWAGADGLENSALALSIFAYWRKDYDHRSEYAYHTLFEVLDVAKNFGVEYFMMDGGAHKYPLIDLARMLANVKNTYERLLGITRALLQRMAGMNISESFASDLRYLFDEIKEEDVAVNLAYRIAKDELQTDADRNRGLREIVVHLGIAVKKQKEITAILDGINP